MKRNLFIATVVLSTVLSFAQPVDMDSLFSWKVSLPESSIAQSASGTIELTLTVAADHIVYENMTRVSVEDSEGFQAGEPIAPEAHTKLDPTDGIEKKVFSDTAVFRIPFTIAPDAPIGEMTIEVTAKYQGCSQTLCYFPQTRKFSLVLRVIESNEAALSSPSQSLTTGSEVKTKTPSVPLQDLSRQSDYFARGYFLTFLFVYMLGIATSFTPCVYPLIPITVTIFGARKTKSTLHAFSLASAYVLGIVIMYSALGYIAAVTGAIFGQFMSNPWVMGGIALFFTAMGLSMLGLFELQLPSSFQARLSRVGGEGYISATGMGLIAGVVAAPCTGPVLGGILAYIATTGNTTLGISLLAVYSLGLGTLFLVIGTYSGMIQQLPKSGGWMEGVKSVFAVILFVCALYFLKNAFPVFKLDHVRDVAIYVITAILLFAGITNGAFHLSIHAENKSERIRKISGVLACVAALYLPLGTSVPLGEGQVNWQTDIEAGLALAQEQNKPVMIDFWAEWCTICKEIDRYTFHDKSVAEVLNERFIVIKIDLTRDDTEEAQATIQRYKIHGLPLIVFLDSSGKELEGKRINEFVKPEDFLEILINI